MKGDTSISGKSNSRRKRYGVKQYMGWWSISGWTKWIKTLNRTEVIAKPF
jgi:hypothetical protein